jgi:hypothetical protein
MTDLTGQLRAALWWLVPLVVLALVIGWETGWGKAFVRHPAAAEPIAPKPVVASVLPDYASPAARRRTPRWSSERCSIRRGRPAPVAPTVEAGRMQRGQFALTGTLVIDGKSTAYLRELQGNKSRRVLAGDKVNGMVVAEVRPDRVRLTMGDESEDLLLKVGTNPRPTAQPAAPVVAAVPGGTPGAAPSVVVPAPAIRPPRRRSPRKPLPNGAARHAQPPSTSSNRAPPTRRPIRPSTPPRPRRWLRADSIRAGTSSVPILDRPNDERRR